MRPDLLTLCEMTVEVYQQIKGLAGDDLAVLSADFVARSRDLVEYFPLPYRDLVGTLHVNDPDYLAAASHPRGFAPPRLTPRGSPRPGARTPQRLAAPLESAPGFVPCSLHG